MKKMEAVVGRLPYAIVLLLLKLSWSKLVANSILMKANFQWNAATENAKNLSLQKDLSYIIMVVSGQFYGRGVVVHQYSKV